MCPDCGHKKMLFETEAKANTFIKFNGSEINSHGNPLRPYFCPACGGWHISSHKYNSKYENRTDKLIDDYKRSMKNAELKLPSVRESLEQEVKRIASHIDVNDFETKAALKRYITELLKDYPDGPKKLSLDCRVRTIVYEQFAVKLHGPGVLEVLHIDREEYKRKYGIK